MLAPQMPTAEPDGTTQGRPGQQSAVVVHLPPAATHALPQTNGGVPAELGTHGRLQQSALDAHAFPASADGLVQLMSAARQRGMPRLSCLQTHGFVCTVPAQHRSVALHEFVASLQMLPAGEHF